MDFLLGDLNNGAGLRITCVPRTFPVGDPPAEPSVKTAAAMPTGHFLVKDRRVISAGKAALPSGMDQYLDLFKKFPFHNRRVCIPHIVFFPLPVIPDTFGREGSERISLLPAGIPNIPLVGEDVGDRADAPLLCFSQLIGDILPV